MMDGMADQNPTLSVIVPTFREAENVPVLFERIKAALEGIRWEMIVVDDDSPDGTFDVGFAIAVEDPRMRCLRRIDRSGLAGAVIEGWMSSSADFVAVIDGDLQHDERILPDMYRALAHGGADLAIGTRGDEGKQGGLSPARKALSDLGAWFFRRVAGTVVNDPMSGFFMVRRDIVAACAERLSSDGFKILVDLVLSVDRPLNTVEVRYRFRKRVAGESKLSLLVGLDFLGLVVRHATGGILPIRFVLFSLVGAFGLVVHLATLYVFRDVIGTANFGLSQLVATLFAMASNFVLNNEITFRKRRFAGLAQIPGFLGFALACGVGVLANIDIASSIYHSNRTWWFAGLAGALLSLVWNYSVSANFIWRPRMRRRRPGSRSIASAVAGSRREAR
jgi:dolichol-phosphate mannosyltransferase